MKIYLSSGHKTPTKRYKAYFRSDIISLDDATPSQVKCILAHSVGLLKSLIWCELHNITPTIIALDPSSIGNIDNYICKYKDDPELFDIYVTFKLLEIDLTKYTIIVFRPERKRHLPTEYFSKTIYYDYDTHYPYMIKMLRDDITKEYGEYYNIPN